jgi:hypothetical protein
MISERTAERLARSYAPLFSKRDLKVLSDDDKVEVLKRSILENPVEALDRVVEKALHKLKDAMYTLFSYIRDRALDGDSEAEKEFLRLLRKYRTFALELLPTEILDAYFDICKGLHRAWQEIQDLLGFPIMFYIDGTIQLSEYPYEYDYTHGLGADGGMVCDSWKIVADVLEEYGLSKFFRIPIRRS